MHGAQSSPPSKTSALRGSSAIESGLYCTAFPPGTAVMTEGHTALTFAKQTEHPSGVASAQRSSIRASGSKFFSLLSFFMRSIDHFLLSKSFKAGIMGAAIPLESICSINIEITLWKHNITSDHKPTERKKVGMAEAANAIGPARPVHRRRRAAVSVFLQNQRRTFGSPTTPSSSELLRAV